MPDNMTSKEKIENRRSLVRVIVTYGAGGYIVIGAIALIIADALVDKDKLDVGKEVFTLVLPIATGVITYWFASRKAPDSGEENQDQAPDGEDTNGNADGGDKTVLPAEEVRHEEAPQGEVVNVDEAQDTTTTTTTTTEENRVP